MSYQFAINHTHVKTVTEDVEHLLPTDPLFVASSMFRQVIAIYPRPYNLHYGTGYKFECYVVEPETMAVSYVSMYDWHFRNMTNDQRNADHIEGVLYRIIVLDANYAQKIDEELFLKYLRTTLPFLTPQQYWTEKPKEHPSKLNPYYMDLDDYTEETEA